MPIECAQEDRPLRCPNLFLGLNEAKYYNVLLQYYCVLRSSAPVLLCTTKDYSNTTLYY